MIRKPNSNARTVVASPNFGCAISTMIAVMTRMSRPTCAVNATAPPDGNDARDNQTTAAFPSGCSAMARTIVVTIAMSCLKTVRFAIRKRTLNALTTAAFQSKRPPGIGVVISSRAFNNLIFSFSGNGFVTSLTIAVMAVTKPKLSARVNIASVRNQSSVARTVNAFHRDGVATMRTIAVTTRMK